MKARYPVAALFTLFVLLGASQARAVLECASCGCSNACTTTCFTGGAASTCGASGPKCAGDPACSGCLTPAEADSLLGLVREAARQPAAVEPRIGAVTARLTSRLAGFVEERGLGVVFAPATGFVAHSAGAGGTRTPDLAFVRRPGEHPGAAVGEGVPELVAHTLPHRSAQATMEQEAQAWLAAGTRFVMVLDPFARTVTVYHGGSEARVLAAEDLLDLPEVLPGWSVRVSELFD
jgi:Uma2 family endonuclease